VKQSTTLCGRGRVDLAVLAVAVVWGSSYMTAKEVVTADSVFAFLVLRFGVAAAGLAILLAPRLRAFTREELGLGVLFGTILSIIFTLETFGVALTSASNAGLIISLTIVITPFFEQLMQHTQLPATFYGAAVIAVVGVGLLTQNNGVAAPGLGDLLMLLAACARAAHVTVIARLSQDKVLDSARITLVQLCTGLIAFSAVSAVSGRRVGDVAAHLSASSWALILYLGLVCTVFAFVVQTWAVRRTTPARVSLLLGTEPLWAAGFGVILAHDSLTAVGVCGGLMVLLGANTGLVIDNRRHRHREHRRSAAVRSSLVGSIE
jgi:drug/metabolite transporter (DMT)-like permease